MGKVVDAFVDNFARKHQDPAFGTYCLELPTPHHIVLPHGELDLEAFLGLLLMFGACPAT